MLSVGNMFTILLKIYTLFSQFEMDNFRKTYMAADIVESIQIIFPIIKNDQPAAEL